MHENTCYTQIREQKYLIVKYKTGVFHCSLAQDFPTDHVL